MAASTDDPTRPDGWRLATIGGVPVYIGRSWLIIALIIVATFGPQIADSRPDLGAGAYVVAVAYVLLLLVSVLAHEAAHAVVATRAGYHVHRVMADLWGGHTAYDSSTSRPGASALVAIAGPAANALLAVVAWLATPVFPDGIPSKVVGAMLFTNGFVAAFNLLPGLPLDGGFLVDSLVWRITGSRDSGLIVAGWCGRVVTVLVVLWFVVRPLLTGGGGLDLFNIVWALFIGTFLWNGATNAMRVGRMGRLLAGIRIDTVGRSAACLPAHASAANAMALRDGQPRDGGSGRVGTGSTVVVVEDERHNAIGLLDEDALDAIPEQSLGSVAVTSVMRLQPDGWVVQASPDLSIAPVLVAMSSLGISTVAIRGLDGRIDGVVQAADVDAALLGRDSPRS